MKIWIWFNHPKGHFVRSERSNLAPFLLGGNYLKNCLITFSLFMQEASQGGTNELSKDGFDRIALKVILKGPKGPKRVKLSCFATFFANFLKSGLIKCISCIQLLGDDIDQLSRDGIDWIIQKFILKVKKVRFGPLSHNYLYYSVATKCCPNLLHHVASLLWKQSCS